MSMHGVANEEKSDLTKEESRAIRQRSLKLLTELVRPIRGRLGVGFTTVTIATFLRVSGPAIIGIAIDTALPAAMKNDWTPLWLVRAA